MSGIVTSALQIAIQSFKAGKTAEEAKKVARDRMWREYNADTQAAAERAIDNYYRVTPPPAKVEEVKVETKLPTSNSGAFKARLVSMDRSKTTKAELLQFAHAFNVKLVKSWTKTAMFAALDQELASVESKAA